MLTPDTRRAIVTAAVEAAVLTAGSDFTSGRRHNTLTTADKAILGDLGRRLAARCALVQRIAEQTPRDHEHAAATFAAAFSSAYDAHLYDLSHGRQRDAEQLAHDVLVALDATSRGREGR